MLIKRFFVLIFFFLVKQLPVANICGVVVGDVYQYHFHHFSQNKCIHPGVLLLAVALCLGAASRHEALESSFNVLGGV